MQAHPALAQGLTHNIMRSAQVLLHETVLLNYTVGTYTTAEAATVPRLERILGIMVDITRALDMLSKR